MLKLNLNQILSFLILHLSQALYSEAFMFIYVYFYFSVRTGALGSFLSAVCAMILGEYLRVFFNLRRFANKEKSSMRLCRGHGYIRRSMNLQHHHSAILSK